MSATSTQGSTDPFAVLGQRWGTNPASAANAAESAASVSSAATTGLRVRSTTGDTRCRQFGHQRSATAGS